MKTHNAVGLIFLTTMFLIPMAMMKKKSYPLNFQKPTAKVITHYFTNSQSPNCWRSHLHYDIIKGDITISHDEVSGDEDDTDQVNINIYIVLTPDNKEEDHAVVLTHLLDTPF